MKWWWQVVVVLLAVAGLFFAGWCSSTTWHLKHGTAPENGADTLIVVKWDTLLVDNPVEVERWRDLHDTIFIAVTDTLQTHDTLYVPLPREHAVYADSTYRAQVSGISPRLDWIEVYPKTIEKTIVQKEKAGRWGIGPQIGVGLSQKGVALPYVGIGVQYNLHTF